MILAVESLLSLKRLCYDEEAFMHRLWLLMGFLTLLLLAS